MTSDIIDSNITSTTSVGVTFVVNLRKARRQFDHSANCHETRLSVRICTPCQ
jgi:hypothetical protein